MKFLRSQILPTHHPSRPTGPCPCRGSRRPRRPTACARSLPTPPPSSPPRSRKSRWATRHLIFRPGFVLDQNVTPINVILQFLVSRCQNFIYFYRHFGRFWCSIENIIFLQSDSFNDNSGHSKRICLDDFFFSLNFLTLSTFSKKLVQIFFCHFFAQCFEWSSFIFPLIRHYFTCSFFPLHFYLRNCFPVTNLLNPHQGLILSCKRSFRFAPHRFWRIDPYPHRPLGHGLLEFPGESPKSIFAFIRLELGCWVDARVVDQPHLLFFLTMWGDYESGWNRYVGVNWAPLFLEIWL